MDRKMLAFDVVVLVVYLAAANPAITGIGAHEWLGLGVCLVLVAHAAISGGRAQDRRRRARSENAGGGGRCRSEGAACEVTAAGASPRGPKAAPQEGKSGASAARVARWALDALIAVALAVCAVSGVMVSGAVLPAFGLYAEGYFFWDPLHAASAKVLLALLLVHVAVHWRWLAGLFGKGKKRKAADLYRR